MPLSFSTSRIASRLRNLAAFHRDRVDSGSSTACRPADSEWTGIRQTLTRILNENIVPFWSSRVIDPEHGGYRLNHDLRGTWKGPAARRVVTQARTLWFFSRLATSLHGNETHHRTARHGYEFLRDRMWDRECGGFYWEVAAAGHDVTRPHKHLYAQAFGLFALSQYAMASKDTQAAAMARQLFELLETHAHDRKCGGYLEFFRRDWQAFPSDQHDYLDGSAGNKTMNTHLHLMEAMTTYYRFTGDELARQRLLELIVILSNSVVRKDTGACTDRYRRDWRPLAGDDRVSYGHDLQIIWLLVEACDVAGLYDALLLDLYRTLFDYTLKHGFDHRAGGVYAGGALKRPADRRAKIWWVQAESLVSALQMHSLTGEALHFSTFLRILNWIEKHQVDWENGDWHARIRTNGKPHGDKAGAWKGPYHNGRAMLKCLELLASSRRFQVAS